MIEIEKNKEKQELAIKVVRKMAESWEEDARGLKILSYVILLASFIIFFIAFVRNIDPSFTMLAFCLALSALTNGFSVEASNDAIKLRFEEMLMTVNLAIEDALEEVKKTKAKGEKKEG